MGKSLGTKPSGKGPGLQKRTKLQRKYLTDSKAQVKRGKMSDLDFGRCPLPLLPRLSKPSKRFVHNLSASCRWFVSYQVSSKRRSSPGKRPKLVSISDPIPCLVLT